MLTSIRNRTLLTWLTSGQQRSAATWAGSRHLGVRSFSHSHRGIRQELSSLHRIDNKYGEIFYNASYETTKTHMRAYGETTVLSNGVHVVYTGKHTSRSPKDKYFVYNKWSKSAGLIDWGSVNQPVSSEVFSELYDEVVEYLGKKDRLYVYDGLVGRDIPGYKAKKVRFIVPYAYQKHFLKNMIIEADTDDKRPIDFTILNGCDLVNKKYKIHGLNSETFIGFNIEKKSAIIMGTKYTGELKKSIFTMLNYWCPLNNILSLHSSACITDPETKDTISFFGLSSTGKTTWSNSLYGLIGDDEHFIVGDKIINAENGCYAKLAKLSKNEENIYNAIRDNALIENIKIVKNEKGELIPDYDDISLTENSRVSYPLSYIKNYEPSGYGKIPKKIVFLSADAYSVLPAVSLLNKEQANDYFLAGYTAKQGGTEKGVNGVQATLSSCFGKAFLVHPPRVYGELLMGMIEKHNIQVYLLNTGYFGGKMGNGAQRMIFKNTKKIIDSIVSGEIDNCKTITTNMGLKVPTKINDLDESYLLPWNTWKSMEEYKVEEEKFIKMINDEIKKYKV